MATTVPETRAIGNEIDRIARSYALRDPEAITAFVRANPEVVQPLLDAVAVVARYFGPDTPLALELGRFPEAGDHKELFALIQTDLDVDSALACLQQFDDGWWLDALPQANLKLTFGLEYR